MMEKAVLLNTIIMGILIVCVSTVLIGTLLKVRGRKRLALFIPYLLKVIGINVLVHTMGLIPAGWLAGLSSEVAAVLVIGAQIYFLGIPFIETVIATVIMEMNILATIMAPIIACNYIQYGDAAKTMIYPNGWSLMVGGVIAILLNIILVRFLEKKKLNFIDRKIPHRGFWTVLSFIYILYSFVGMYPNMQSLRFAIATFLPPIIGVVVLYELSWLVRRRNQKRIQKEYATLQIENSVMKEYYRSLEDQIARTRKLNHDI